MSTFQIHEDTEITERCRRVKKVAENRSHVSKKRTNFTRNALQPVNNIEQETKRPKLRTTKNIRQITTESIKGKEIEENSVTTVTSPSQLDCLKLAKEENSENDLESIQTEDKGHFSRALLHNNEYRADIWVYLKQLELKVEWPKATYMKKQKHLTSSMRNVLVDWLVAVADEYNMNDQTLHLSVNYIDRFLSRMSVVKEKFQLLGSAAMMLAAKMEEIYPPDTKEWSSLTGYTYTTKQITRMEQLLLKILNFDAQPPTILTFIHHLCVEHSLDKNTLNLAKYFSELVLLEGEDYLKHLPSKLAASSVALARLTLSKRHPWPKTLETSSGYSLKQLSPVVQQQNITFRDSPTKTQQAIHVKYQSSQYQRVALLKPKSLNFEAFHEE